MMAAVTDVNENIKAQDNINDVLELLSELRRNKEPLLHTAVFIELKAGTEEKLRELLSDVQMELTRSRITVDKLLMRQQEGFLSVLPCGRNLFKTEFEEILPASSTANLLPLNYSGKTDEKGFVIGRDKYGSNVLVDFDKRTDDKTNSYMINPLEPKSWGEGDKSEDAPEAFRRVTRLSQHISYLKDFLRAYKDFTDSEMDCLEIMLMKLYARFGIDDSTD